MVKEQQIIWLIENVIDSFHLGVEPQRGIPLGNLTSQIFANIYLNELDQFAKHKLKVKYYLRYADDFIMLGPNSGIEDQYTSILMEFLKQNLKLELHPNKIFLRKFSWGIDFCGYVLLPQYILPRVRTRKRIVKRVLKTRIENKVMQSYLGYFCHSESFEIERYLKNMLYLNYTFDLDG